MKPLTLLLAAAGLLSAQSPAPATLSVSPVGTVYAYPGAVLNLQISLVNAAGWNIADIAFGTWAATSGQSAGAAAAAANKTLYCGPNGCLLTGLTPSSGGGALPITSSSAFADGVVMTLSYTIPTTQAVGSSLLITIPSPVMAVDTAANAVTVSVNASPLMLPVVVNPACIQTAQADVQAFLAAPAESLLMQLQAYLNTILAGTCH